MSRRFFLDGDDDDDSSSQSSADLSSLPYPKPLARSAFLVPDFDAATYLSSLGERHQTLEDLREELSQRSQDIKRELLNLVNANYEGFIDLGDELQGGDERIDEIKIGVLGFKRDVESMREKLRERREEVERIMASRRAIKKEIMLRRSILSLEARMKALESRLMIKGPKTEVPIDADRLHDTAKDLQADYADESDSDDDSGDEVNNQIQKLKRLAEQHTLITRSMHRLAPEYIIPKEYQSRQAKIKEVILLDLGNLLKRCTVSSSQDRHSSFEILEIYRLMDAGDAAIQILRSHGRRR